ncbi:variant erythrocyte surface antigen-1 family protein [Babesia divergens]|uniref:Variant erythrocyte surface antigen-1 family protein n=1 Tax=Babesia divergens TaxID=32595 RepID=A0AAD9G5G0_BABDI|nr:variant erythrocyte surface antigen-1 family protein [Babesia divergens]
MCIGGEALPSSLFVPRTLRSVLTGSSEPLGGIRMVCYMYYTDVFVGTNNDNIDNLKNALKAELGSSGLNELKELKDLADGLEKFIGYDKGGQLNGNGIGKSGTGGSQKYVSSYNSSNAQWPECSQSRPCSACSSSCSHSGPSPCHGSCCPNCDVQKAAKIFLGMLPCIYYALKYLNEKCNNGGWRDHIINHKDSSLGRFLSGMGYNLGQLDDSKTGREISELLETLFTGSNPLPNLYEKCKKYFASPSTSIVSPSDSPSQPKTVREILLWLYGLRFQKHFPSLVSHCSSLCSPFGNSFNSDAFCYYLHVSCFLLPVSVISVIQCPDGSPSFLPSHSYWESFSYPSDTLELFEKFCDFVRKIFTVLTFLYFQCKNYADCGGWKGCYFGSKCAQKFKQISSTSGFTSSGCTSCNGSNIYLCSYSSSTPDVHSGHCQNGQCLGSGPCTTHTSSNGNCNKAKPCPHPLMRFLIDGSSDSDSHPENSQKFRTPFHSSTVTPMGFESSNLSSTARDGLSLHDVLKYFCDSSSTPLTRLVQFILCVSQRPPETLGELFGFFMKFVESSVFRDHFASYVDGEPGRFFGNSLKGAIQGLYGSEDSHSGSSHTPANLFSLSGCHANKGSSNSPPTCGPYLHALTDNVSGVFTPELCSMYLSWICHLTKDFKEKLKEFQGEFSSPSCCPSSGSSCPSIVKCPCALPLIYSQGFQFMSPDSLSGNDKKSCKDFIDQLGKVISSDPSTPLQTLLTVIDNFLWSIRLPFIYAFLYIWILVISYFYYVQFYKLDLLHIDSHLHLPRSFKILPSTLFSDASSKLKDLSYFSL